MVAEILADASRALDGNASPLSGATWTFYATGTTTLQTVYANASLVIPHPNPVTADTGGKFPPIYFDGSKQYRGVLRSAEGTKIYDIDPINAGIDGLFLKAESTANTYPYPINVYTESDDPTGGGPVASTTRVIQSLGAHSKVRYGNHTHVLSDGSGVAASPASADFGAGVSIFRKDWQTNSDPGEIDGFGIVAVNGVGDVAGLLVDVGSRDGFSAVLEGASRAYLPDGSASHKLRVQSGVVDSHTGVQIGHAVVADLGVNDVAYYAASGGGSFEKMLQFVSGGQTTFQVNPDGAFFSTANAVVGLNAATNDADLTIGLGRTGSGNSYLDLVGDTTYTDYGGRFSRNGGPNGTTAIEHRGTGTLQMKVRELGTFSVEINGSTFFSVEADGAVVFGSRTATADAPITGYIEIKDRLGVVRRLAVIG